MIVGPESSFVNFMTLAESVALAPIIGFWISLATSSGIEVNDFDLLTILLLFLIWTSSYIERESFTIMCLVIQNRGCNQNNLKIFKP